MTMPRRRPATRTARLSALLVLALVIACAACAPTGSDSASTRPVVTTPTPVPSVSASRVPLIRRTSLAPGDHILTVSVQGRERQLILHIPPDGGTGALPLALVYHGGWDTAGGTESKTNLARQADEHGYLVAFLQGYENSWNDHGRGTAAEAAGVDDIAFTKAAIAEIKAITPVDRARIAAVGFSNGAFFVDLLGCEMAETFSFLLIAEGQLSTQLIRQCAPTRPISVYEVHGNGDPTVPYDGGSLKDAGYPPSFIVVPVEDAVRQWAAWDRCAMTPERSTEDGTKFLITTYTGCADGVTVALRMINGGVHEWPSDVGELVAAGFAAR